MKRVIFMTMFFLILGVGSFAQEKAPTAPVAAAVQSEQNKVQIKTIVAYKTELGLSDKQEKDLRAAIESFQKNFTSKRKELGDLQKTLGDMLKNKESLNTIKKQLEKIARVQVDLSYMDIETSRKVEGVLTPAQLTKWKTIQEDFKKNLQKQIQEAKEKKEKEDVKK